MAKVERKYYYRRIRISHDYFSEWLNLPKGFFVDAVHDDPDFDAVSVRVRCPSRKEFLVEGGTMIPDTSPLAHTNKYGFLVKLWHPDLGQKEPKERRPRRIPI